MSELPLRRRHRFLVIHAVVEAGDHLLRRRAVEIVQIGFGRLFGTVALDVLSTRATGNSARISTGGTITSYLSSPYCLRMLFTSDSKLISTSPAALNEGGGRTATAGIEHQHVFQEASHEGAGLGRIVAVGLIGGAPAAR